MKSNWLKKKLVYILAVTTAIANMTVFSGCGSNAGDSLVERTVKNMTMDEKYRS